MYLCITPIFRPAKLLMLRCTPFSLSRVGCAVSPCAFIRGIPSFSAIPVYPDLVRRKMYPRTSPWLGGWNAEQASHPHGYRPFPKIFFSSRSSAPPSISFDQIDTTPSVRRRRKGEHIHKSAGKARRIDDGPADVSKKRVGRIGPEELAPVLDSAEKERRQKHVIECTRKIREAVHAGDMDKAALVFTREIKEARMQPDVILLNTLLKGYVESGNLETALTLLDDMPVYFGIMPNFVSFVPFLKFVSGGALHTKQPTVSSKDGSAVHVNRKHIHRQLKAITESDATSAGIEGAAPLEAESKALNKSFSKKYTRRMVFLSVLPRIEKYAPFWSKSVATPTAGGSNVDFPANWFIKLQYHCLLGVSLSAAVSPSDVLKILQISSRIRDKVGSAGPALPAADGGGDEIDDKEEREIEQEVHITKLLARRKLDKEGSEELSRLLATADIAVWDAILSSCTRSNNFEGIHKVPLRFSSAALPARSSSDSQRELVSHLAELLFWVQAFSKRLRTAAAGPSSELAQPFKHLLVVADRLMELSKQVSYGLQTEKLATELALSPPSPSLLMTLDFMCEQVLRSVGQCRVLAYRSTAPEDGGADTPDKHAQSLVNINLRLKSALRLHGRNSKEVAVILQELVAEMKDSGLYSFADVCSIYEIAKEIEERVQQFGSPSTTGTLRKDTTDRKIAQPLGGEQNTALLLGKQVRFRSAFPSLLSPSSLTSSSAKEVWIELGFGAGEHVLHLTRLVSLRTNKSGLDSGASVARGSGAHDEVDTDSANKNICLVACEILEHRCAELLVKLHAEGPRPVHEQSQVDVMVFKGQALDALQVLMPSSVSRIFLLYPSPPRPKFVRGVATQTYDQGLLCEKVVHGINRVLKRGGQVMVCSDNDLVWKWMDDRIAANSRSLLIHRPLSPARAEESENTANASTQHADGGLDERYQTLSRRVLAALPALSDLDSHPATQQRSLRTTVARENEAASSLLFEWPDVTIQQCSDRFDELGPRSRFEIMSKNDTRYWTITKC